MRCDGGINPSSYHIFHHGESYEGCQADATIIELLKYITTFLVAPARRLHAGQIGESSLQYMLIHLDVGCCLAQ